MGSSHCSRASSTRLHSHVHGNPHQRVRILYICILYLHSFFEPLEYFFVLQMLKKRLIINEMYYTITKLYINIFILSTC